MHIYDVLVIGSGISGLSAAYVLGKTGLSVAVISKAAAFHETNTFYAQGGIVTLGIDDSQKLLERDIFEAGDRINSVQAVKHISERGPRLVDEFLVQELKVPFSRNQAGELDYTREAAHSTRRILHIADTTGEGLENSFIRAVSLISNVQFFSNQVCIDLITNSHNSRDPQEKYKKTKVLGAYILNSMNGTISPFFAPQVILATGGVGSLFQHTSNPPGSTGDGIAMAYRVGAEIIHAEYVQFHPTILYNRNVKRFLITEALRGEGARLVNVNGSHFMGKYSPGLEELAPRDEVSRAIFQEMELTDSEFVYLDASSMKNVDLKQRFPRIYDVCRRLGMNIEEQPIPVVPGAHYFCGGIKVDLSGKTSIGGLYAVGECACTGVHGANRLASVSLLEGLTFGIEAGLHICSRPGELSRRLVRSIPEWISPRHEEEFDPVLVQNDLKTIAETMWNYVGIIRNVKRLNRALSDLNYLAHRIERFYREAFMTKQLVELRNGVLSAVIITRAALANGTSRGCHYRTT